MRKFPAIYHNVLKR